MCTLSPRPEANRKTQKMKTAWFPQASASVPWQAALDGSLLSGSLALGSLFDQAVGDLGKNSEPALLCVVLAALPATPAKHSRIRLALAKGVSDKW